MKSDERSSETSEIAEEVKELLETSVPVGSPFEDVGVNKTYSFPSHLYSNTFKPLYHETEETKNNENVCDDKKQSKNPPPSKTGLLKKLESALVFRPKKKGEIKFPTRPGQVVRHHEYDKQIMVPDEGQPLTDKRTTVMIKNIPNRVTAERMKEILDRYVFGKYNFFYLRIDFTNHCNVGYAFINFAKPDHVIEFYKKFQGYMWDRKIFKTTKIVYLAYASIQGIEALKAKFRSSIVMEAEPEFRPKMFYTTGPYIGEEKEFFTD